MERSEWRHALTCTAHAQTCPTEAASVGASASQNTQIIFCCFVKISTILVATSAWEKQQEMFHLAALRLSEILQRFWGLYVRRLQITSEWDVRTQQENLWMFHCQGVRMYPPSNCSQMTPTPSRAPAAAVRVPLLLHLSYVDSKLRRTSAHDSQVS